MATKTRKNAHSLFETGVDLGDAKRSRVIDTLNQLLADMSDLRSQVKQAHWNVKGPHFYQLHLLFDEIAGELDGFTDDVAERAVTLGGVARGTVRGAAEHSSLPEYPDVIDGMDHVAALVDRLGQAANTVRARIDETSEIGDQSTADLLTEISRALDKRLWFLQAHLQGGA